MVVLGSVQVRERDWCNVITAHEGDPSAYVWRLEHFTIGKFELRPPPSEAKAMVGGPAAAAAAGSTAPPPDAPVTCVALSRCGNFGIVGSSGGRVDRYNMQSGLHRGAYLRRPGGSGPTAGAGRGTAAPQANGAGGWRVVVGLRCQREARSVGGVGACGGWLDGLPS